MDKRRNDSYEETHRRLVEAMQEACIHDDFADYPEPDIDISFIYDDVEDDFEEIPAVEVPKKKHFGFTSRFNKVAAILVVLLLTGNIVLLATDSNDSYGQKGLLHRLSETVTGVVTDNDNPVGEDEVVDYYMVYTEKEIDKMTKKFPDLYVPSYIPVGYEFEFLTVKTLASGDWLAVYEYSNKTNRLNINISYCLDLSQRKYFSDPSQTIELNGKIAYMNYDVLDGNSTLELVTEECTIEVDGQVDEKALVQIAKNMKKAH